MRKNLITFLLLLITPFAFSNDRFVNGYFIDNTGKQINCLIKSQDWSSNPFEFKYRLSEEDKVTSASIDEVSKLMIGKNILFVRKKVNIDRSSDRLNNLSKNKSPEFKEEEILLRVLLKGTASLYRYKDKEIIRFFYEIDSASITQLIHKTYSFSATETAENNQFRQQLFNSFNSTNIEFSKFQSLEYKERDLRKLFVLYNENDGADLVIYESVENKATYTLSIKPSYNTAQGKYENFNAFGLGAELELFLSPKKGALWALFVEPSMNKFKVVYHSYSIESTNLETNIGTRYHIPVGFGKLFLEGMVAYNLVLNSKNHLGSVNGDGYVSGGLGAGLKLNNGIFFEARYSYRYFAVTPDMWTSVNFTAIDFVLGIPILKNK